jgi:ATP-binding cassette subfamily F protein 3
MLQIASIEKRFVSLTLFEGASLHVAPDERVALVGPNGCGKTTLLRILAGEEAIDGGQIVLAPGTQIGYLKQDVTETTATTVLEEVLAGRPEVAALEHELEECTLALAENPDDATLLRRYGELVEELRVSGGAEVEVRAKAILTGLGLPPEQHHRPVRSFSGGWMMRISLAKLLLRQPDLLLLDEPTNHLDLETIRWLEDFLWSYRGTVLVVSHDQHFLNRVVKRVVEIRDQTFHSYTGNYDDYLEQKAKELELLEARYLNQQRKITQYERFIERFRYKSGTLSKQVQSRIKMLERIERIELPEDSTPRFRLRFPQPARSALKVMELSGITKAYGDNFIFRKLDLTILRGQKIAVVGRNGAGKSTLLKVLAGVEPIQAGERRLGGNLTFCYYAQHQLDVLNPQHSVLEEISGVAPELLPLEVRRLAGAFLFSEDEATKPVGVLSGGEKARVALARMLARPANFLVLDEPTNHLDIQARQVLEQALAEYEGTLIMISHDRAFINSVANMVLEVERGRLFRYDGDYEYYLWKKEEAAREKAEDSPIQSEPVMERESARKEERKLRAQALQDRQRRLGPYKRALGTLEGEIASLEKEKALLTEQVCQPSLHADQVAYPAALRRLDEVEKMLGSKFERWTALSQELESSEKSID